MIDTSTFKKNLGADSGPVPDHLLLNYLLPVANEWVWVNVAICWALSKKYVSLHCLYVDDRWKYETGLILNWREGELSDWSRIGISLSSRHNLLEFNKYQQVSLSRRGCYIWHCYGPGQNRLEKINLFADEEFLSTCTCGTRIIAHEMIQTF